MAATNDLIPDFDDFERYHSGEMPSDEQRLLEGRMLAEPLVADAYEGFLAWRAHHTHFAGVRADLHERLHVRVAHERRNALPMWAYASAASVLLALFAYWAVFLRDQTVIMQKPAVAISPKETTPAAREQKPATIADRPAPRPEERVPAAAPTSEPKRISEVLSDAQTTPSQPLIAGESEIREEATDAALADSEALTAVSKDSAPQPASALAAPGSAQAVGKSMAARAKAVPSSLYNVAEKGGQANAHVVERIVAGSGPAMPTPAPAAGWPAYQAYLNKNTGSASSTGQIVVTFIVNPSGALSGFTARGPQELHKEAIRIISTGPAWAPALVKGNPVASTAEIQLQFRQSQ